MAQTAGIDPVGLSGHSTRVGAQDMVGARLDVGEVMVAEGITQTSGQRTK